MPSPRSPVPGLLVSVRSPAEAEIAVRGGAAVIDVKEPRNGALGRAEDTTIAAVVACVAGRLPVSAALGELLEPASPYPGPGLTFVKWGLAGAATGGGGQGAEGGWQLRHQQRLEEIRSAVPAVTAVTAAYADWQVAGAPPLAEVLMVARKRPGSVLLLDTWQKSPGRTLLDCLSRETIYRLCRQCREMGLRLALAGSLGPATIAELLPVQPDWFAVRGAACAAGEPRRDGVGRSCARTGAGDWALERFAGGWRMPQPMGQMGPIGLIGPISPIGPICPISPIAGVCATRLQTALMPNPRHHATAAIHLHLIAILEPARHPAEGHNRRQPQLACHNCRVRQQTAALHQQPRRGREQHDPARVGALGHQDLALPQFHAARIGDHAHRPLDYVPDNSPARAAVRHFPRPVLFFPVRGFLDRRRRASRSGRPAAPAGGSARTPRAAPRPSPSGLYTKPGRR